MGAGMVGTLALIYAGFTALAVAAAVSIVRKAGYSGWWVVVGLVPLANVVMLFAFAFADWPVLQQLRRAQAAPLAAKGHPAFATPPALVPPPAQTPYRLS
jgi:hypothetical protein